MVARKVEIESGDGHIGNLGACPRIGAVARESWFESDFSII